LPYQEINPVVSPLGAFTNIHLSPLVTNPNRTSQPCSNSIIRVATEAFQRLPANGLSKSCPAGTT
jgi:hypothetical protein